MKQGAGTGPIPKPFKNAIGKNTVPHQPLFQRPAKGEWAVMAVQIGVSPEALYRELAKRRLSPKLKSKI